MSYDRFEAILSLVPDAQIVTNDGVITWINPDTPTVTEDEITARMQELQRIRASLEYRELRAKEYPPVTDYLDAVVKGDLVQQQAYIDACLAVKAKYPKPEGL
jgi:hypothetical protein